MPSASCRGVQIAADLKKASGPKLKDFREALEREEPAALGALRRDVEDFAKQVLMGVSGRVWVGVCVRGGWRWGGVGWRVGGLRAGQQVRTWSSKRRGCGRPGPHGCGPCSARAPLP